MPRSVARLRQDSAPLDAMLGSWVRALEGENKSPYTIRSYGDSVRALIRYLGDGATTSVTADDIRGFLAAELDRIAPASVAVHYRNLRVFFGWLSAEEPSMMPASPMARVGRPAVAATHKPPFSEAELKSLLKAAGGNSLDDRRDTAILRVLIDTGMRVSGLAGLRLRYLDKGEERSDVQLGQRVLIIRLKGGRETAVPVGRRSVAALDRYLRGRPLHPQADSGWLWLGAKGQFTTWGIRQMLARRGVQAGVADVHPHRFRRTFAHDWLHQGGQESDLMKITGWTTRDMIEVYAGELAGERARVAHARLSPGDRI
jgi:site-specific recombinase XerD